MKKNILICELLVICFITLLVSCSGGKKLKRVNQEKEKTPYEQIEQEDYKETTKEKDNLNQKDTTTTTEKKEKVPEVSHYDYNTLNEEYTDTQYFKNVLFQEDFESIKESDLEGENFSLTNNTIYEHFIADENRAPNIVEDKYKRVCALSAKNQGGSYFSFYVDLPTDSHMSCDMYSDVFEDNALRIIIDDLSYSFNHPGVGAGWLTGYVDIKAGKHKVTFKVPFNKTYYIDHTNAVYIDNIIIVKDEIAFLEIEPKGLQETFERGSPIYFKAVALRGDRSKIDDIDVSYSVSGGGSIDADGKFTPKKEGLCTITAKAGGLTAKKENVLVHQNNYFLDPVEIGGHIFTGKISDVTGQPTNNEHLKFYNPTPTKDTFSADGFFVIEADTTTPIMVFVEKEGDESCKDHYLIRNPGFIYKRIWFRNGPGDYLVKIYDASEVEMFETKDGTNNGDYKSGTVNKVYQKFYVKNTNKMSKEDAMVLLPSSEVDSDDFLISNRIHDIVASLPRNASQGDILTAVNNWIVNNITYDPDYVIDGSYRLRQDSSFVYLKRMGVCVGYSNLCAAMLRKIGIKTRTIESTLLDHEWNQVQYKNKWYLLDTTWNDPQYIDPNNKSKDKDSEVYRETYTYFMTGLTDEKHTDEGIVLNR